MDLQFEWVVVGAGPAGIAAIGKLLDVGINPSAIAWIDPKFLVGDFAASWQHVMSNTPVSSFRKFYNHCQSFQYPTMANSFLIEKSLADNNCPLMIAAQPLSWITQHLKQKVASIQDEVLQITPHNLGWQLTLLSQSVINTKKIILAVGANAKELDFGHIPTISLKTALTPSLLKQAITPDDHLVVFGAAQSAVSVVTNLSQVKVKKINLFYRNETLFTRHFHDIKLDHVEHLEMTPQNLLSQMQNCTKAIYAIGFNRRHIPIIGLPANYGYNETTGEIAPNIFGLGMAFPEIMPYEMGRIKYHVTAIWPFMKRIDELLPRWLL